MGADMANSFAALFAADNVVAERRGRELFQQV